MNFSPIESEADYKAALSLIDRLSDARIGTEEFDTLDAIVTFVEAYEAKHYPIGPPDPIVVIEYDMEKRGLTTGGLETINTPKEQVVR